MSLEDQPIPPFDGKTKKKRIYQSGVISNAEAISALRGGKLGAEISKQNSKAAADKDLELAMDRLKEGRKPFPDQIDAVMDAGWARVWPLIPEKVKRQGFFDGKVEPEIVYEWIGGEL